MRIQESSVQLSSSHEASRISKMEVTTEQGFRKVFESLAANPDEKQTAARERVQKLLQSLIDAILAAMDGKKCEADFAAGDALPVDKPTPTARPEITWKRKITETLDECEKTTVCGQGTVKTSDGRQIEFNYTVDMARQYHSDKSIEESGTVALRDPLVLSFDGKACELTDDCISFDLDADGKPEQIPGLAGNSGFLVFDRNGNGKADNGSELFGVASGNGFADLARLDDDGNGWIDENDSAWERLRVWQKTEAGEDRLTTLREANVGALNLASVVTPFDLKNDAQELLGQIRSSGVFLAENGRAGTIQQVDLTV